MLRPSYTELMEIANAGIDPGAVQITSRYSIVIAAAKRAREIIDKSEPLTMNYKTDKPVTIAVQEMVESLIKLQI